MRIQLALLTAILLGLLTPLTASAQACSRLTWGETRSASFVFSYQEGVPLGAEIAAQYAESLDEEFLRFARLFGVSLPLPILVRVYPNERDYYCFNALAPQIPLGQTHSTIGGREIALIADNIAADPEAWSIEGLDALRFELAVLFTRFITADHAPPGLLVGTGIYAQDPFVTLERRLRETPLPDRPAASWRNLWDAPDLIGEPATALQAGSITAYLVDVYGWERYIDFLNALRTADTWRQALDEVYPADSNALETQWSTLYFERWRDGRWRENALYGLSLVPYEQLIAAGAYQAAADGLAGVIELLVELEDFDRLSEAQTLNIRAQSGLAADGLARQARQAYLEGDFEAAIDFAAQASERYAALADVRNQAALDEIRSRAAEALELRAELASIEGQGIWSAPDRSERVLAIDLRLQELGDSAGAAQAAALRRALNERLQIRAAWIAAGGILLAAVLLLRQFGWVRRMPPPEARLQS